MSMLSLLGLINPSFRSLIYKLAFCAGWLTILLSLFDYSINVAFKSNTVQPNSFPTLFCPNLNL